MGLLAWRAAAIPQLAVKNTDFVEKMVTNFIYDLPFSQSQPLDSAEE
jgi:hypothetical protein